MRTQPVSGPAASDAPVAGSATAPGAEAVRGTNGSSPATSANGRPAQYIRARLAGPGGWSGRRRGIVARIRRIPAVLQHHWLASILIALGVVLRALAQMAYHPAIIYIDTLKYLYDAWPGSDPVGYKVPLKAILAVGTLGTVEVVQHLLGIGIAITMYVVLVRRGVPRWLGALAIAPVLLDAYQVQVESMIMPDIWFEALVVAGIAVLLWRPQPGMKLALIGGALLGASTGIRQVGEVLIIPALIFVVAMGGGWRKILQNAVAVTCAFALAVLFYLSADYQLAGHFWVSRSSVSLTYGRMAGAVDCATINLPKIERPLCPTKKLQAMGPDWLDHGAYSPLRLYDETLPIAYLGQKNTLVADFNRRVERQQPQRVISAILHDSVKLFALNRYTSPGDTPIVRWQFQRHFPTAQYGPWISVRDNKIWLDIGSLQSSTLTLLNPAYGGAPQVNKPIAAFLRWYQLRGGYTPGPLFALCLIAGLAGSVIAFWRRPRFAAARPAAVGCVFFFAAGVIVLGVSDLFEFTWRYQIPALITLPPAAALGIAAVILAARKPREPVHADAVPGRAPEMAAQAP
ncbi:MAG TPA: hypothetical protein VF162_08370 [Streptosporangiaceae bacterium]